MNRFFFTVDWSQTWFDSDIVKKAVLANIGGLRGGRTFDVGGRNLAVWIGTMYQNYESATVGTVTGEEIFSGRLKDALDGYEDTQWYQDLGAKQKLLVEQIAEAVLAADPGTVKINYSINKKPADPSTSSSEAGSSSARVGKPELKPGSSDESSCWHP